MERNGKKANKSVMECQRKSVDPESKASASLDTCNLVSYGRGAIQGAHGSITYG